MHIKKTHAYLLGYMCIHMYLINFFSLCIIVILFFFTGVDVVEGSNQGMNGECKFIKVYIIHKLA